MSKIGLIISREFNQRVRKRSFIITTILTPLLMLGFMFAPALLMNIKNEKVREIVVLDQSGLIAPKLENSDNLIFTPTDKTEAQLQAEASTSNYGYLIIGKDIMTNNRNVRLYANESTTMEIERSISGRIGKIIEGEKLKSYDIDSLPQILNAIKSDVSLTAFQTNNKGDQKESSSIASMGMSYIFGFMIYMFVLLYGNMVMQGVIEEKSSKVLEIMVSSVRPFELMMGKILGIGLVAVTQFLIWIAVMFILGSAALQIFAGDMIAQGAAGGVGDMGAQMGGMDPKTMAAINNITDVSFLIKIFAGFLVYFIGGYLLYAAMYAAIGSAVDNIQDTQQLQMPVTIPLILAIVIMMNVMQDPTSPIAFWGSMIPLTSPIIMMARIPYGVPAWELALSITILYASFISMVWFAGKIYRVGIFMYGKKPSFKELLKWIRYKY